jgi:hypothetical protein
VLSGELDRAPVSVGGVMFALQAAGFAAAMLAFMAFAGRSLAFLYFVAFLGFPYLRCARCCKLGR